MGVRFERTAGPPSMALTRKDFAEFQKEREGPVAGVSHALVIGSVLKGGVRREGLRSLRRATVRECGFIFAA